MGRRPNGSEWGLERFDNQGTWGCSLIGSCRFPTGRSSLRPRHSHFYLQSIWIDLPFFNLMWLVDHWRASAVTLAASWQAKDNQVISLQTPQHENKRMIMFLIMTNMSISYPVFMFWSCIHAGNINLIKGTRLSLKSAARAMITHMYAVIFPVNTALESSWFI